MNEYKIIKQKFNWKASSQPFEDDINNFAKQGWHVVNVYNTGSQICALLERNKNR
ncbi:MAG TPA: hypothetical protein DDZ39_03025 [Flavobacteriaceae bacterium]|jgi:hypothetical protein|nr:hypothetical protein [Flavobacteriaceae bacterium]